MKVYSGKLHIVLQFISRISVQFSSFGSILDKCPYVLFLRSFICSLSFGKVSCNGHAKIFKIRKLKLGSSDKTFKTDSKGSYCMISTSGNSARL